MSKVEQTSVFDAANKLRAEGITPTVRALKAELGGSTDIIAKHLREWRALYPTVDTAAEVDPITALISEIYDRLLHNATERLHELASKNDKKIEDMAVVLEAEQFILDEKIKEIESLLHEKAKLELLVESQRSGLSEIRNQLSSAESDKRGLTVEVAHYKEKSEDLEWQLKQEKERNNALETKAQAMMQSHSDQLNELLKLVQPKQDTE